MADQINSSRQLIEQVSVLHDELVNLKKNAEERMKSLYNDAESAVKESEKRYQTLIDSVTDYVYTVLIMNGVPVRTIHAPGCEAITGYVPAEYEENPSLWFKMIHPDDQERVLEHTSEILSGEKFAPIEHRIVHKNGEIKWIRNTPVPRYDLSGCLVSYDGLVSDITDRREAEEALKEREELFRVVSETAGDAIICLEAPDTIILWNKKAEETFGYPAKEALGRKLHDFIVPERFKEKAEVGLKKFFKTGKGSMIGKTIQMYGLRKDGTEFPVELTISAMRIRGTWQATGIIRDITESLRDREALEKAKRDWESTFDGISSPIFLHDKEFRIIRMNRAYMEASKMSFDDIVGRPYYEVFPKMERPFKRCRDRSELNGDEAEEEYVCPVTGKIFNMRFYPVKDPDGITSHSIHILEDISERKKTEERLRGEIETTSQLLMIAEACADTKDVDRLMGRVADCTRKITGCEAILAYIWDGEMKLFRPLDGVGLKRELMPVFKLTSFDPDTEFLRQALNARTPFIQESHDLLPWFKEFNSLMVLPLVVRKEPLGLLLGLYTGTVEMDVRLKQIARGVTHQVCTALEQARLYKESVDRSIELSRRMETIRVMNEIDRSILSTLDPQQILETAAAMISRVISCDIAAIDIADELKGGFINAVSFGNTNDNKAGFVPFNDTSMTEILKTERYQYLADLSDENELLFHEKELLKEGLLSQMRIPMTVKRDVVGILTVGSKRPSAFTSSDLSTLENLSYQLGVALQNARQIKDLEELFLGMVKSLSSAIDAKSPWTAGHSERVTAIAVEIGKEMKLSTKELKDLELGGLLHDVGKIGTYESILDKPGKLTEEEETIVRLHPQKGAEILSHIKQLKDVVPIIKYHHEFYDGSGYPIGLKGERIPHLARIIAVADSVDAMIADRPYRSGRPMDLIIAELQRCSGTRFDPRAVDAFLKTIFSREYKVRK